MPEAADADVPPGIVSVRISKSTGCPADSMTNPADVMFESFRIDHIPQCESVEELPDLFNLDDDLSLTEETLDPEEETTLF